NDNTLTFRLVTAAKCTPRSPDQIYYEEEEKRAIKAKLMSHDYVPNLIVPQTHSQVKVPSGKEVRIMLALFAAQSVCEDNKGQNNASDNNTSHSTATVVKINPCESINGQQKVIKNYGEPIRQMATFVTGLQDSDVTGGSDQWADDETMNDHNHKCQPSPFKCTQSHGDNQKGHIDSRYLQRLSFRSLSDNMASLEHTEKLTAIGV
ncbi:hypothetical protein STEG23_023478, partial [Scotinomys teguina]